LLQILGQCGSDIRSIQPAVDDINRKLSSVDERVKKVGESESDVINKIGKIFEQEISNFEKVKVQSLSFKHRLT
jgi:hypothetical protein